MLCQRCHKNAATVRYAEVIDGRVTDVHLCQSCLDRQEAGRDTGFELAGSVPTPRVPRAAALSPTATAGAHRTCTTCGVQLREILSTRQVGCSVCYDTFSEELESMLKELHTSTRHRGKSVRLEDQRSKRIMERHSKRAMLRTALKSEDYEGAAVLRDALRRLDNQDSTGNN